MMQQHGDAVIPRRNRAVRFWAVAVIVVLVALDLTLVDKTDGRKAQVIPYVDTDLLGESTVAIACSQSALAEPVALDQTLTFEQVDAVVRHAIQLDQSDRSLAAVVEAGDWVAIKVNIVTMPLVINGRNKTSFWDDGFAHWGQATDLRVVKSVIDYLVNEEGDARRITIVEGGAEWSKLGEEGTDPDQTEDGWTVHWEEFDNLSYTDIVAEYDGVNGIQVDIIDLNYDDWVGTDGVRAGDPLPVPDPNHSGFTWFQRPEGFYVSRTLLEVDKLVNIAAMKTHDIPGVTLLHKQYVGTFMQRAYGTRSNSKYDLHKFGNEFVPWGFIDLFSYCPTDYGIIEGFWSTEGDGPQWGQNVQLNVVLAGGDPVATDAVGAVVMGYNPEDLVFLRLSAAKGFGTYDLDHIRVVGETIEAVQRDFDKTSNNPVWGWGNRRWLVNGPYPVDDLESTPIADEAILEPALGEVNNGLEWSATEDSPARFALFPAEQVGNKSVTYAFAYIQSDRDREGILWMGVDQGAKVWLNHEQIVAEESMNPSPDAVKISVSLRRGANPVMVKVRNNYGPSGLSLLIGDEDGDSLPGIGYSLEPQAQVTAVMSEVSGALPTAPTLGASYPNPFNSSTVIPYVLSARTEVGLAVYDMRGTLVRTLVHGSLPGGAHATAWDGRDAAGRAVGSGVYLYRLRTPTTDLCERMTVIR